MGVRRIFFFFLQLVIPATCCHSEFSFFELSLSFSLFPVHACPSLPCCPSPPPPSVRVSLCPLSFSPFPVPFSLPPQSLFSSPPSLPLSHDYVMHCQLLFPVVNPAVENPQGTHSGTVSSPACSIMQTHEAGQLPH